MCANLVAVMNGRQPASNLILNLALSDCVSMVLRRKYLPIDPSRAGLDCAGRAYINVMASSETDAGAVICCRNTASFNISGRFALLARGICSSKVRDTEWLMRSTGLMHFTPC